MALVGVAGFVAASLTAVAAGRAYTGTSTPPTRWFGLVSEQGWVAGRTSLWGVLLWLGIAGLSVSWLAAVALARRRALTERVGWTFTGLWALPLALGPPAVSKDVYAYAAQGLVLHHGGNVYRQGPEALAGIPGADAARALAAVDPRWRDDPSPYGPVTAAVQWLAAVTGNPVTAVIALRVVAVLGVIAVAWCCVRLTRGRRAEVLALVALNPVLLVHGLSAAHVETLMCAGLVAALLAAGRGHWRVAIVLATLAGLVKAPAFLAVVGIAWWWARGNPARTRRLLESGGIAGAVIVAISLAVPDGWGWLRNLKTPGGGEPTSSVTGHLAALAEAIVPGGKAAVTVLGVLAALAVLVALARTFERRHPAESLGWGLLAVAFLAPVTYPWYALWGLVCVLPFVRGRALVAMLGLSVLEAGWSIPGGSGTVLGPLVAVTAAASVVGVVVAWRRQPADEPPDEPNDGVRRSTNAATPSRPSAPATQREIDSAS